MQAFRVGHWPTASPTSAAMFDAVVTAVTEVGVEQSLTLTCGWQDIES